MGENETSVVADAAAEITAPGPALGRILGLDHVTLPVTDLDAAVAFYRDVLGADLESHLDRAAWRRLFPERAEVPGRMERATLRFGRGPSLQLFVAPRRAHRADEHPHWAFAIGPRDVAVFRDRLDRAGVRYVGPVHTGPLGQASIYLHDPSGNLLELTTSGYPTTT
jgi:catechol 2,3-dioxygenase-like lactoylglutathione lyase family enzyme